ncbi:MAG: AMP-binding protein [Tagaea sp.]|nr:AMP-binding protein [Tagaea sp.]
MNIAAHLLRNARRDPEGAALALGAAVVSDWAGMVRDVARLAGGLRALGLEPGARVAILAGNSPDYARALYAIWWAGLVAVPINAKLHPKELAYCLEHAQAALILHSDDLAANVAAAGTNIRTIEFGGADWRKLHADAIAMADAAPDSLAWLFYTSGTTGRPKGAMLTHRNILAMATSYFIDIDPPRTGGAILHAAPMSHGSGLYMFPTLAIGGTQVVPESGGFDPAEIFDLWKRWNHVTMFAAPTMIKRLTEARGAEPGNLRVAVFGGAPMYVADLKAAIGAFGYRFAQLYGQGESPMCIAGMTRATIEAAHKAGDDAILDSVGTAQSVVEMRCAEDGEVLVRGDSVMKGYWRDEAATAKTLRDGWLHTGDVGEIDPRGYLTLKDRSKDLIISGGSNIYPREVEEVLQRHQAVAEVSVIGAPDPEWGENVVAFVVRRHEFDAAELDALCLANIARFKRPKRYVFVDALPKNAYGKILKTELRKSLTET